MRVNQCLWNIEYVCVKYIARVYRMCLLLFTGRLDNTWEMKHANHHYFEGWCFQQYLQVYKSSSIIFITFQITRYYHIVKDIYESFYNPNMPSATFGAQSWKKIWEKHGCNVSYSMILQLQQIRWENKIFKFQEGTQMDFYDCSIVRMVQLYFVDSLKLNLMF